MNTHSSIARISASWALAVLAWPLVSGCSRESAASGAQVAVPTAPAAVADAALAPYRVELLDLAFDSASAFPLVPHVKNRSRAQEAVVMACLELDQPQRALRYAEKIENWRRGKCFADIAYHIAEKGRMAGVQELLDQALRIAEGGGLGSPESPSDTVEMPQEWRGDRIRAAIARTYLLIGQADRAAQVAGGVVESESGRIRAEEARRGDAAGFDARIAALDALVAPGSFDGLRAALAAYAELYDRYYGEVERRDLVEQKIEVAWAKLPIQVRIETLMDLGRHALGHDDAPEALELVGRAQTMLDGTLWTAESHVPLSARLAELRFRAGDLEKAQAAADAALAEYETGRESVVNIYRAGVLRPLAEAYHAMREPTKARLVYAKALEEGVVNPNSRPRAEDLAATATSMAVRAFEPDAALLARMKEIRSKLGDPW